MIETKNLEIQGLKKSASLQISEKINVEDFIPSYWRKYRVW